VLDSPLPQLTPENHELYVKHYGLGYKLHTELILPDREAHYSKMISVRGR
jgi:hypothetical protein